MKLHPAFLRTFSLDPRYPWHKFVYGERPHPYTYGDGFLRLSVETLCLSYASWMAQGMLRYSVPPSLPLQDDMLLHVSYEIFKDRYASYQPPTSSV